VRYIRFLAATFLKENENNPDINVFFCDSVAAMTSPILKLGEDASGITFMLVAS
jgi:hypothetical protein